MTVAFSDAVHLTEILRPSELLPAGRDGLEWEKIAPLLRAWFWERKKLASVVNIMSVALYDLFGGADGMFLPSIIVRPLMRQPTWQFYEKDALGISN